MYRNEMYLTHVQYAYNTKVTLITHSQLFILELTVHRYLQYIKHDQIYVVGKCWFITCTLVIL